ncbi:MAG: hypothetical protein JWN70_3730 [Planctomycetaceae bacterium]|nr:hypothetical protein [Planctomycetaceae bacterium]
MNQSSSTGVYTYFDGDDVGANIELRLLEDDVQGAALVSARVSGAVQWIRESLERDFAGQIMFAAGDEVLAFLKEIPSLADIDHIRVEFRTRTGLSVSCGVGESAREAASQLRLAKLRGKNRSEGIGNG